MDSPVPLFEVDIPLPMGQPETVTHVAPVTGVPEGSFHVRGRLVPTSPQFAPVEVDEWVFIDRTPPVGEILAPPEGGAVCLAQSGTGADALSLLMRAEDVSPEIGLTAAVRSQARVVRPLNRLCGSQICGPDDLIRNRAALALTWDATFAESGEYDLLLRLCDRSGNVGTSTRHVFITREPPNLQVASTIPEVFSPNSDGVRDETTAVVRVGQAGTLTATVHAGSAGGPLVRTLLSGQAVAATDVAATWDGLDDSGSVAPDGAYAMVFTMGDACGGEGDAVAEVEIDTTPPEVAITEPAGGQRVSASVEVLGEATDPHLAGWELDVACGGTADWTPVRSGTRSIPAGTFVAFWDTSRAPPGECQLRLAAEDDAGNRSPEAITSVLVERGDLIERLFATPAIFSPNGDGRLETASLELTLARSARVRLELRREGEVVRTLEADTLLDAGPVTHVWDGWDDLGTPAPDGGYQLWMRAEDPDVATVYEEEAVRIEIDTVPPVLSVTRPLPNGVEAPSNTVVGSVDDANLLEYVVTGTAAGGGPVELGRGSRTVVDGHLAPLGHLEDGPHTLRIDASDLAENSSELEISLVVDSIPPTAVLQAPSPSVLHRGEEPIPIVGLVRDDHLEGWTLRFGPGAEPASFTPLSEGIEGGNEMPLAAWDVRHIPDGVYTLSLTATDRGGLSTEARVTLTLDGQAPRVAIEAPEGGGYVTEPLSVVGSATDAHLVSWTLEVAPGEETAAWQWAVLGEGTTSVPSETLAGWSPLPEDGVYALRLRAEDEVGLTATTHATLTVDTTPPATPTGLEAHLSPGEEDGYALVRVSWNPNSEPDLAGYRIASERGAVEDESVEDPLWHDGERLEGRYDYRVTAFDHAGNESPPATLDVLVDLTPPTLAFLSPEEGAAVSGALEVTGTAWSTDDFAEYRLLVGEGESPTAWTLLQRSTVPVAAGRLGDWLALTDGPHVLALEAEDTRGNEGRITRPVVVDTLPPEAPVLVSIDYSPAPVDLLVPEWDPSPSEDVAGYLVSRNGRIANAGTVVLGDLSAFLVDDLEYFDDGLPDGEHCYTVVAMDEAGNTSVPSNELCRSLDNRAPQAMIVQPEDGTRFGAPIRVVAETPDLDVATVLFERREAGHQDWSRFGERTAVPWEVTLDPEGLPHGDLRVEGRRYGRDRQHRPRPFGHHRHPRRHRGPAASPDLVARVDGADVTLSWSAPAAPDLDGYRLYRDGERIVDGLTETTVLDTGLDPETYAYTVTAVDERRQRGRPQRHRDGGGVRPAPHPAARGPSLEPAGGGGGRRRLAARHHRPHRTCRRDGGRGPGQRRGLRRRGGPPRRRRQRLVARGVDADDNRSLPSGEIVVIANDPPGPRDRPRARVAGADVSLGPGAGDGPDLFGYLVRRDGAALTASVQQTEAASLESSVAPWAASQAFDGNPATAWPDQPAPGEWRVASRLRCSLNASTCGSRRKPGWRPGRRPPTPSWRGGRDAMSPSSASRKTPLSSSSIGCPQPWPPTPSPSSSRPRGRHRGGAGLPSRGGSCWSPGLPRCRGPRRSPSVQRGGDRRLRCRGPTVDGGGRGRGRGAPGRSHRPSGDRGGPRRRSRLGPESRAGRRGLRSPA